MKVPSCLLSSRTLFPYRVFDEGSIMFNQKLCRGTKFLMRVNMMEPSSKIL
jgi:hypothetical protein